MTCAALAALYGDDLVAVRGEIRVDFAEQPHAGVIASIATLIQALEEYLKQLPQNSIEADVARNQRLQNQWGSSKIGE